MPLEYYKIGSVIGRGSYGEVMTAKHKRDKKQYVIKKINLQNASDKERGFAEQEVQILSKLRHPNIVSYKESFQDAAGMLHIVMGYCEGGDLYKKLKEQAKVNEPLDETQIIEWFVQITMALQYMHARSILHRDLKTQNIFLTKSKIIKVGDLGIARVLDSNADMATTLIGTPYYMSPELFSNKPYNHKSDVWALGCCVYEMATLKHAFNGKDMNALVYKILKGKLPPMPSLYSDELQTLIKAMLSHSPDERPSASRILRHSFIKKNIAIFLEGTKSRRMSPDVRPVVGESQAHEAAVITHHEEMAPDPLGVATASEVDIQFGGHDCGRKEKYVVKEDRNQNIAPTEGHRCDHDEEKEAQDRNGRRLVEERRKIRKQSSGDKKAAAAAPNPFAKPKPVSRPRPLPPKPITDHDHATSAHTPRQAKEDERPKLSIGVPNRAARQKRRQRISQENPKPVLASRSSCDSVDGSPIKTVAVVSRSSSSVSVGSSSSLDGSPAVGSQESISDGGSVSEPDENDGPPAQRHRRSSVKSDVNGLISKLEETLELKHVDYRASYDGGAATRLNDDTCESAAAQRLKDRIVRLREECVRGIGERDLVIAYRIIDECEEDGVEAALVGLIGRVNFERYGGQIWQLKFCEEFRS